MRKIREVLRLRADGFSEREIARSVGCARSSVQICLWRADKAGVSWPLSPDQDEATLETLQSVFVNYTNADFPAWGRTRSVLIPATGKKLDFTYWLQPRRAPVVYMVPGLGAHRLAGNEMALAELLYQNGYSAVCISSSPLPLRFPWCSPPSTY